MQGSTRLPEGTSLLKEFFDLNSLQLEEIKIRISIMENIVLIVVPKSGSF